MSDETPSVDAIEAMLQRIRQTLEEAQQHPVVEITQVEEHGVRIQLEEPIERIRQAVSWVGRHRARGWSERTITRLQVLGPQVEQVEELVAAWRPVRETVRIRASEFDQLQRVLVELPGNDPTDA